MAAPRVRGLAGCAIFAIPVAMLAAWAVLSAYNRYGLNPFDRKPEPSWSNEALAGYLSNPGNDGKERSRASQILGQRGAEAVPLLTPLLSSKHIPTRLLASHRLGTLEAKALPALPDLLPLHSDPDSNVATYAIEALTRIAPDDPRVLEAVTSMLKSSDPKCAMAAASVLDRLQPLPLELIIEAMVHSDKDVRSHGVGHFLRHARSGQDAHRIVAAFEALIDRLGTVEGDWVHLVDSYPADLIPVLRKAAQTHPDAEVRWRALTHFYWRTREPLDPFLADISEVARSHPEREQRFTALNLLSRIGPVAWPMLTELSQSPDELMRISATQSLRSSQSRPFPTDLFLVTLFSSKDTSTRQHCLFMLGIAGAEATEAIPLIESLVRDREVRESAQNALKNLQDRFFDDNSLRANYEKPPQDRKE